MIAVRPGMSADTYYNCRRSHARSKALRSRARAAHMRWDPSVGWLATSAEVPGRTTRLGEGTGSELAQKCSRAGDGYGAARGTTGLRGTAYRPAGQQGWGNARALLSAPEGATTGWTISECVIGHRKFLGQSCSHVPAGADTRRDDRTVVSTDRAVPSTREDPARTGS